MRVEYSKVAFTKSIRLIGLPLPKAFIEARNGVRLLRDDDGDLLVLGLKDGPVDVPWCNVASALQASAPAKKAKEAA